MPTINYSKTIIYQVFNKECPEIYVNFTTDLAKRKYNYKKKISQNNPSYICRIIQEHGGLEKWEFIVLERFFDCMTKKDAQNRAREWEEKLRTIALSQKTPQNPSFSPQNPSLLPQNPSLLPQNPSLLPQNPSIISKEKSNHICKYCTKTFARKDNASRHMKTCKMGQEIGNELLEQIRVKNDEIENMKKQLEIYINTNCKIHPKTLNKINNMQQNNHNSNNHIINNNYTTIVELGKENLLEFFTAEQQKQILNKKFNCLDFLIETVHFNNKLKQFQSVAITNAHDAFAYKYVEKERRFITVNKEDLLQEIVTYRMQDICEFFENCKTAGLDEQTIHSVRNFIDEMEEDNKRQEEKIKNIRLIMYNKRKTINMKLLKSC